RLPGLPDRPGQPGEALYDRLLLWRHEKAVVRTLGQIFGLAQDRAAASVVELQIGRAVSLKGEHGVPVKADIAARALVEVVIDHRADTHRAADLLDLFGAKLCLPLRDLLPDDRAGPGLCLIEHLVEEDRRPPAHGEALSL